MRHVSPIVHSAIPLPSHYSTVYIDIRLSIYIIPLVTCPSPDAAKEAQARPCTRHVHFGAVGTVLAIS